VRTVNGRILAVAAACVVCATVAFSIWHNPPSENRARALDEARAESISTLKTAIDGYFAQNGTLPARLDQVGPQMANWQNADWRDPETRRPFEYHVLGKKAYRLCAVFTRNSDLERPVYRLYHRTGRTCYDFHAGPNAAGVYE
jgi:hypothetical protein